jgi:hypothetical protein
MKVPLFMQAAPAAWHLASIFILVAPADRHLPIASVHVVAFAVDAKTHKKQTANGTRERIAYALPQL